MLQVIFSDVTAYDSCTPSYKLSYRNCVRGCAHCLETGVFREVFHCSDACKLSGRLCQLLVDKLSDCTPFVRAVVQDCVPGLPFRCPQNNGGKMLRSRFVSSQDFTKKSTLDVGVDSPKKYL